jgi:outer membrane protein OmpA-like peptidoglycan-associated protein
MDADGDGIPDSSDLCTLEPEDLDGTMDEDGCPELDNDGDGINDADDLCPTIAEDINGVDDDDGCPDSDRDGDGIADIKDKCPLDPEDIDKFEDTDGCPDLDADRDGIPDARDQCPALAETYNEIDDTDGCPESTTDNVATVPPKITTMHTLCEVRWSDIHFAKDDASLTAEARSQLQKLSTLLKDKDHKPAILHVLISGHASAEGTDKHNYRLSKQRARVTYRYLRELGVSAAKISERALGESAPANDHPNKNGLFENRRVSFQFELSGRCDR